MGIGDATPVSVVHSGIYVFKGKIKNDLVFSRIWRDVEMKKILYDRMINNGLHILIHFYGIKTHFMASEVKVTCLLQWDSDNIHFCGLIKSDSL